ncbi:MAG: type II secretion system protein [Clostridia bacterium]|nr:type II secretion system protein [Clostridia bacterium]
MHKSKKGFTIVELVIVIAVIAILAAVLIPTFSNLVKKANIANDTALAKNINTALTAYKATNAGDMEFEDVIAAARDAGYIISNLNPTTAGHYFVWEKSTNQILLVDGENAYKVIYANNEKYAPIGENWYFATSDKTAAAALKADAALASANIKDMIANVADLSAAIADGGEVYLDESVVLDKDNLIILDQDKEITLNLGTSSVNTSGIVEDVIPVQITSGNVTIKGGIIGGGGSYVDEDGKIVSSPILTDEGATTVLDGTAINVTANNGYPLFAGETTTKNVVINSQNIGAYVAGNAVVTLENTSITSNGRVVWSCNLIYTNEATKETGHAGTAHAIFKSGTYHGGNNTWAPIVSCGGKITIEGGTFTSNTEDIFQFNGSGEITVKGGTFAGKTLSQLGKTGLQALCANGTVTENADGSFTIKK